ILVRTPQGQVYSSSVYTVTGAPTITSFTPASGPVGTVVTVTGSNFTGATQVYVGNGMATAFTVVSDTELKVTVPALASTGAILVRTPQGQVYSSSVYTVDMPKITLSASQLTFTSEPNKSVTQQYVVEAKNLEDNKVALSVSGAGEYTISASETGTFAKSLVLTDNISNKTLAPTSIWVKYSPTTANSALDGSIAHSSLRANTESLTLQAVPKPLPVELVSFSAGNHSDAIMLNWVTASEKDNDYFDIEVAHNLKTGFEKVGTVKSKVINSSVTTKYTYKHYTEGGGTRYYRLKQVDLDGTSTYSKIVAINIAAVHAEEITIAPNPLNYNSKVYISAINASKGKLRLTSVKGSLVYSKEVQVRAGQNEIQLPVYDKLQSGLYILTVELEDKLHQIKVIKQ
ncbi:IPT/TIG domain-containing protein, partial [Pontibacter vulgaris]|uniref:IPT/TIG domain-containing protein n=1 Tax=Pontibacter vulgaris TaxID=2905679 RepID=UPI001FA7C9C7